MKAIILNGGKGSRMGNLVKNIPKCLVELKNKETILGSQLVILKKLGITEIIIVTGYLKEKIIKYASGFDNVITYIDNPLYLETNAIYGMYLCSNLIDDDFIVMHGDMVFEEKLILDFLKSEEKNSVLVSSQKFLPKKDFKAHIKNNIVEKIGVNLFDDRCKFLLPFYKLDKKSLQIWMNKIVEFVKLGRKNIYAEEAFNEVSLKIKLKPFYFENALCMEIDNEEDLKIAREKL